MLCITSEFRISLQDVLDNIRGNSCGFKRFNIIRVCIFACEDGCDLLQLGISEDRRGAVDFSIFVLDESHHDFEEGFALDRIHIWQF